MKKLLSVLLVLSMLLALASCGHECEFSADWSSDDTSHWHTCTDEECELIADKADHTWDEGTITTVATQEADGVRTFTCSVCAKTKTEPVPFTGMTSFEWNSAFANSVFENFMYNEVSVVKGSGVTVDTEVTYKLTATDAWVKIVAGGQNNESYAPDTASANELREELIESIKEMTPYAKYSYDAESKTYKANAPIRIDAMDASTPDIVLTFADGKLAKIEYTITFTQSGIQMEATSVVTFSDYGSVTFAK